MISVIVGGGPSLEKTNLDLIKPHYCIGCNAAFFLGDWIDAMIFGDCRFNTWYGEDLKNFRGQKHTLCPQLEHDPTFIYWKKLQNKCFTLQQGRIGWHTNKGPNTGSAAINLACQLGFTKMVLVGFDGQMKDKGHNCPPLRYVYHLHLLRFSHANRLLSTVQVYNSFHHLTQSFTCSPYSRDPQSKHLIIMSPTSPCSSAPPISTSTAHEPHLLHIS